MKIARLIAAALLTLSLGACAEFQKVEQVYTAATTTTVPAAVVVPAANAFDALKGTAANFATYCINEKFVPAVCSVTNRRAITKFIRSGTAARVQMEASLSTGQPVVASVYNILIAAVAGLKATPVATFGG